MSQLQRRYEGLLSACGESVLILEMPGTILGCSPGNSDWLKPDAVIGRQLQLIFPSTFCNELISLAVEASHGEVASAVLGLRPKASAYLSQLGLTDTIWYQVRCAVAGDEVIVALQDISEIKQLRRTASGQTLRDSLTGCFNRRAFRPVLEQNIALAQRYDAPFSVMLIDVDHFNQVNDEHSMDAGDLLLQKLVEALQATKRTSDFLARYVADEFILLMPETGWQNAVGAGERVRKLLQGLKISTDSGEIQFTVSVGLATINGPTDTADTLLSRAGQNLFVAKESGGNRVEADQD